MNWKMRTMTGLVVFLTCGSAFAQEEPPSWEWTDEQIKAAVNKVRAGRDLTPEIWPDRGRVA
ncbi:MAG: hypothetical protein ACR2QR_00245, partial [Woeseiaceae bacterium]